MPPKQKYTREVILDAAFQIARENGIDAVVARDVGKRLGCTVSPIFSYFSNMDELQNEVRKLAYEMLKDYLRVADEYAPAFKMRGMQIVKFAKEEPKLFTLLFMSGDHDFSLNGMLKTAAVGFEEDLTTIQNDYNISESDAFKLFNTLWVYAYGVGSLIATGTTNIDEETIISTMGQIFMGGIMFLKSDRRDLASAHPQKKTLEASKKMEKPFNKI